MAPDPESPGWSAITSALAAIYGEQVPLHVATIIKAMMGGPDPLDGMSAYLHPDGHWHYVGYGLTELYVKESPDPEWSGFGFELTFRLEHPGSEVPQAWSWTKPPAEAASAPRWPYQMLQALSRFIVAKNALFLPREFVAHQPPDAPLIAGLITVEDPALGSIDTPHGRVQFIQLVGLDADRFAQASQSVDGMAIVVETLVRESALLVTPRHLAL